MRRVFYASAVIVAVCLLAVMALPALGAGTSTVRIRDNFFAPKRLTVAANTRVVWRWTGMNRHNVTLINAPKGVHHFHSGTMVSGSFARHLARRGTYVFMCTIHGFRMRVVVH